MNIQIKRMLTKKRNFTYPFKNIWCGSKHTPELTVTYVKVPDEVQINTNEPSWLVSILLFLLILCVSIVDFENEIAFENRTD